jgi:cell division ATPase FtsA
MKIKGFSKKIINKPIEGKTLTALDIGTENIKALIAKNNNGTLEIRGVGKQHQRLSDMGNGAISDISGVVRNCEEALKVAEDMAGG